LEIDESMVSVEHKFLFQDVAEATIKIGFSNIRM